MERDEGERERRERGEGSHSGSILLLHKCTHQSLHQSGLENPHHQAWYHLLFEREKKSFIPYFFNFLAFSVIQNMWLSDRR